MENGFAEGYAVGQGNSNNNNGWGNSGEWIWAIIALAILANGGFGFGGFGGGFGGGACRGACATQADLAAGFNNSAVLSSLNDIKLGQAQAINYNNQGFSGLNTVLLQGFHGVDNAVCTLGYQTQTGFNALSREIGDCCCQTQRAIDSVNYNMAKNTCDIIQAGNANTQRIVDFLVNEKICALQSENVALKGQISNDRQTANIVSQLRDGNCPIPAYLTCDPRVPFNYGQLFNNNCGCGC